MLFGAESECSMRRNTLKLVAAAAATSGSNETPTRSAMERCRKAFIEQFRKCEAVGKSGVECMNEARMIYRLKMPAMDSLPEIRSYIACVAQGIQFQIFNGTEAGQLIYAAQVALSSAKKEAARRYTTR